MISAFEAYLLVLALGCVLAALARRLTIPYPILLVPAGVLLSFLPGLPRVQLNPELVLQFFLPPLVYAAGAFSSWRDFWVDIRAISLLSIGLVLFTTLFVATVACGWRTLGGCRPHSCVVQWPSGSGCGRHGFAGGDPGRCCKVFALSHLLK